MNPSRLAHVTRRDCGTTASSPTFLCLLAGHVLPEDYVNIGGHVGVHHFTTLGNTGMRMTKIAADVPPFLTVAAPASSRQEVRTVNGVGLCAAAS
ncbi:MAG: hypothetical protein H6816_14165 [Phycisphaerales bacterium]|nr:hypothetical protein [Phycisphaerales bacterium]